MPTSNADNTRKEVDTGIPTLVNTNKIAACCDTIESSIQVSYLIVQM